MPAPLRPFASGFGFVEAPRWHAGRLWFVDYFAGAVFRADEAGQVERVIDVPGVPGGLGFLPDGTPLVVSQREFRLYAIRGDGSLAVHAELGAFARGAANELLVDGHGRAYVGHHGFAFFDGAPLEPSTLLRVSIDGTVDVAARDLIFPNGMALAPDGRTLYVAESFANRLTAFAVDAAGNLSGRRPWANVGEHTPDGVCLDEAGALWCASPLSGQFLRVKDGEIVQQVAAAPGRWAVALVAGGADRRTLYCLSAATTLEDMPKGRSQAFIETLPIQAAGAGIP